MKAFYKPMIAFSILSVALLIVFLIKPSEQKKDVEVKTFSIKTAPTLVLKSPFNQPKKNEFLDQKLGFSFFYPEDWRLSEKYKSRGVILHSPIKKGESTLPRIYLSILEQDYIYNPINLGYADTIKVYPYTVSGLQATRWSIPSGTQSALEIVRFSKDGLYYEFTLMYADWEGAETKNKNAVNTFNKLLSSFRFNK